MEEKTCQEHNPYMENDVNEEKRENGTPIEDLHSQMLNISKMSNKQIHTAYEEKIVRLLGLIVILLASVVLLMCFN